ncbi:MAG: MATE family efflux transporter [Flavobacteriales bacterium]|nr:MATE family efflux transporter [Flavobacteriales bacterium]MCB9449049.1 MATE family efflux transporter [Flavobacteriales bacterium]
MQSFIPRLKKFGALVLRSVRGEALDFTQGNISASILLLAIPMILEMMMESTFAVVDIYFVSRIGVDAVATVGLTESILTLVYSLAFGSSMAVTAMVARRVGEKNLGDASRTAMQAIWLSLGLASVISVAGLFLAENILLLMGAEPGMAHANAGYTRWMLGGNYVIMLIFMHNAIFRGAGNPFLAWYALGISNGLNIILDPMLIFGWGPFPQLGLEGAAIATNIGRGVGVLFQLYFLFFGNRQVCLKKYVSLDWKIIRRMVVLSTGGTGQFLIASASWVFLMKIMAHFGSENLAGYVLGIRVLVFTILPAWGLSNAAATLVGQNLGAGLPDRAEQAVWRTGWFNMAFMGLVALVYYFLPEQVLGLFDVTGDVLVSGVRTLKLVSLGYLFFAWGMVFAQAFNGAGDTQTPTWMNFIVFWLLQIPVAYLTSIVMDLGPVAVLVCIAAAEGVLAAMSWVVFRRGKWKLRQV